MKIVVTGGDGQLGSCLKNCFKDHRFFFNKKKLDITNYRVLKKKIKRNKSKDINQYSGIYRCGKC